LTTIDDGSEEGTDHKSALVSAILSYGFAKLVCSMTQTTARFIVTASDVVDDGFASALASRCSSFLVPLEVTVGLWTVGPVVGVGGVMRDADCIATASAVGFAKVCAIDVYARMAVDGRPSSEASCTGLGRFKFFVSSSDPRPCGAAKIWQMKMLATAAPLKME